MQMDCPRVQLRDGRFLAYKETGVPRNVAKFKVVVIHGLGSCRNALFPCSQETLEELGVYMVGFDRAGYGYSDPFPERSVESEAYDIQDLADVLGLGRKFFILAISIGGYSAWGCLNYIPERIAGAALMAPAINYWWPCFPKHVSAEAFSCRTSLDRFGLRMAHYTPKLHSWWSNLRRWFPDGSSNLNVSDQQLLRQPRVMETMKEAVRQGTYESVNRDLLVQFSSWKFDPSEVKQPGDGVRVSIWQGDEDYLVPASLQRYLHEQLPWTVYHELPGMGHLFFLLPGRGDEIIKHLVID